ncbi:MAG TPA: sigma-54-dependent Fis family transcriptional regulator [Chromatiales bacterium]|nr:sigma-54-dependent Fis family transcriptional regulator [Chromatiales bacterium]
MKEMPEPLEHKKTLVFFVDDEPVATQLFARTCQQIDLDCRIFLSGEDCLQQMYRELPDLILTDLNMPEMNGFELIHTVADEWPSIPVIAITGQSTIKRAVEAMRLGASDFLKKPYQLPQLESAIHRCLQYARVCKNHGTSKKTGALQSNSFGMVGNSAEMWRVFKNIERLAEVNCPVIIQGESGTGKELAARAIHDCGNRSTQPFIVIDCGSLTDTLLESELFGHKKGAFTGANQDRVGLFEAAGGGTIFLDEIGNISDSMQAKLLRVCQEKEIMPVGSNRAVPIHARFVVASNQNLDSLVRDGSFRHDLYYRLNVITISMPSLAQRRDDIPLLVEYFIKKYSKEYDRPIRQFSPQIMNRLCQHNWQGNVRELANFVERCVIMVEDDCLDSGVEQLLLLGESATLGDVDEQVSESEPTTLEDVEMQHIHRVLEMVGGNQVQAAKILGINRSTLWRRLHP